MPRMLIPALDGGLLRPLPFVLLVATAVVLVAMAIVLGTVPPEQPARQELLLGPMRWLPPDGAA